MSPATVLLSSPPGSPAADLRKLIASAGFAVADHSLGSSPAAEFDSVAVVVIDVGDRVKAAASQTRRWRAELGDQVVPIVWVASPESAAAGLEAGADVALARPVEPAGFVAQLRSLARLRASAARTATRAAEARLLGDQLKKAFAQLEREQDMARCVHRGFLPKTLPEVGRARFGVSCRTRGGDFHDVRRLDERHVGFLVGEVVGTGGLLGVLVQQVARLKEITGSGYRIVPPDEVLTAVNRELLALRADDLPLVAMMAGVLNAETGAVALARAGLPAAVHVPASGPPGVWAVPGPFLGTADTTYQALCATLAPGDRLLIGTDGTRPDGDPGPAGADRLLEAAASHRDATGPGFVDAVANELLRHVRHADDFTLLCAEMIS